MIFTEITKDEFREFATKSPYQSFMQTPEIAELREKNGWTAYYLAAKDGEEIKAASMLVAKPTFLGKSTFIAPGGPLLDLEDAALTDFFIKNLKKYIKSHNGYVLHISPYYEMTERDRHGDPIEGGFNHQKALKNLQSLGFTEIKDASQPKYTYVVDIDGKTADELMADFKSNTRGHIRKAEKMGVTIRELNREELNILKDITESTSKRRGFTDRPLSYYEQMYDLFHDRGEVKFVLAEVGVGTDAEAITEPEGLRSAAARAEAPSARGDGPDGRGPKVSNNSATPLSAAMFMLTGDEVVYLFSGSDEKYMKDYNAQYLIQWHMLKYAAKNNFKRYNFYGIHGLPDEKTYDGVYEFKKGFGGHVVELIGTFETPLNAPFYALYKLLRKLKRS